MLATWDSAYVFGMVTSHNNGLSLAHGERGATRAFVYTFHRHVDRLFCCWYLSPLNGSPDNTIHHSYGCCVVVRALLRKDSPCSSRASTAFPYARI